MNVIFFREKYAKRLTSSGQLRHAPGGADVLHLCDICERLEQILRYAQRQLPSEEQNKIEQQLWKLMPNVDLLDT